MKYYEINETQARQAKAMWSFSEYEEGSETRVYRKMVDAAYNLCEEAPEERREKALYYADMYAKKLAENINKRFRIELMCPSVMICGPANFPVRKKEKQNAASEKNSAEYGQIQGYLSKIKNLSNVSTAIMVGDENALELLQNKVVNLEALQADMKAANAYYRKHKTMRGYAELSEEEADSFDEQIKSGYSWEQQPYPSYTLTNNNAKLRSARQRLDGLTKTKARPTAELETEHFKVIQNTEIMRLQLVFDGKPSAEIRSILKSNGFKWAPSQNAWQRQLTNNAMQSLEYVKRDVEKMQSA